MTLLYKILSFFNVIFLGFVLVIFTPYVFAKNPAQELQKSNTSQQNKIKITSFDELLKQIQQDHMSQKIDLQKREAYFLKNKNQQKYLLKQAIKKLHKQEIHLKRLQSVFEKQDGILSTLEEKLILTMGALGELFGVVKQQSGELKALFQNSIISSQYKNRIQQVQKISAKTNLPDISDLEHLWFLMQQEIIESGQVVQFKEDVINANGETQAQDVIRVGSFNLVSQSKYLLYDKDTKSIFELARQPHRRYVSLIKKLKNPKKDLFTFGIDPSKGSLLSLLIQTPNLIERISQGGLIGYVLILLFIFGCILSIHKFIKLQIQEKLFKLQINTHEVLKNNPLGDVIQVFLTYKSYTQDILELKMEEIILKKTFHFSKGLSTIKLLSNIAPLLGLLGTVTGMIITFQSITLFGTGDPKLMAGGISQALVTTALGLVVAIPLVFIHNFLSKKSKNLTALFEEQSLGLLSKKYTKSNN